MVDFDFDLYVGIDFVLDTQIDQNHPPKLICFRENLHTAV